MLRRLSRKFIYERRTPHRKPAAVMAQFRVRSGARTSRYVEAQTRDLSASGLALESPVIQIDGLHLYDSADMVTPTRLDVVLGLPSGTMTVVGEAVRYDKLDDGTYVVGVKIVEISPQDRTRYGDYVATLKRK
jgi:hypothetical protein